MRHRYEKRLSLLYLKAEWQIWVRYPDLPFCKVSSHTLGWTIILVDWHAWLKQYTHEKQEGECNMTLAAEKENMQRVSLYWRYIYPSTIEEASPRMRGEHVEKSLDSAGQCG